MFRSTLALVALLIPSCIFAQVQFLSPANGAHGASLPATCKVGDEFQLTAASSNSQWYLCTATNTWTSQGGSGSSTTPGGSSNAVQFNFSGAFGGVLNTTATNKFLTQSNSGVPAFNTIQAGDVPNIAESQVTNLTTDLASKVATTRNINTTAPLTGGGALSSDLTLAVSNFTGDSGSGGTKGIVPAPAAGDAAAGKFLSAAGGWSVPAGGGGGSGNFPTGSVSGANLTVFSGCIIAGSPCNISRGNGIIDQVSATNVIPAPATGTGNVYVYWTSSGGVVGSATGVDIVTTGAGPLAGHSTQGITTWPTSPMPPAIILKAVYSGAVWTSVTNYAPVVSNPPNILTGTGLTSASDGQNFTVSLDTGAASVGTGTANYVARWNGNGYTLSTGTIQDNGTNVGIGCAPGSTLVSLCGSGSATQMVMQNTNSGGFAELDVQNNLGNGWALGTVGAGTSAYLISTGGIAVIDARGGGDIQLQGNNTTQVTVVNGGGIVVAPKTVSTLPTCNRAGWMIPVSDATSPTYGGTLTGGGSTYAIALCNGSTWTAH